MGQADPTGGGLPQDLFTIWERILTVANSHGKRLEQIVNRKPSARLRPSAKENKNPSYLYFAFAVITNNNH